VISMGKVHDYAHRGLPLEAGWAVDKDGEPTTDAAAAKQGAISPFGGPKGYALGLAFELLVASLTAAALGDAVRGTLDVTEVCNKGDVFIVMDPGRALQAQALTDYLEAIRTTPPAAGFDAVLVPGDRALAAREARLAAGLPVADEVWTKLRALAERTPQEETTR